MKASLWVVLMLSLSGGASIDDAVSGIPGRDPAHVSSRSDDAEFLRRLSLDLLGYPPNARQAESFLASQAADKRSRVIDEYLDTPRFADFWARRIAQDFFGNYREPNFDIALGIETQRRLLANFITWLREQIQSDRTWPEILTEILTARGRSDAVPQIAYKLSLLRGDRQELEFAAGVSRHFLGVNLHCARCHDHPTERWRPEDVFQFGAFNTRQVVSRMLVAGREEVSLQYAEEGELRVKPLLYDAGIRPGEVPGGVYEPVFLSEPAPGAGDRVRTLTQLILKDTKRRWAKVFANRTWGWLMGKGVVEPLEDFGLKHPPVSRDLLEALVATVDAGQGSLKSLIRAICRTEAYQRASWAGGKCDLRHYCRAEILPLCGEQLINSVQVALRGAPGLDLGEAQELTEALSMRSQVGCEVEPLPCGTLHALLFRNSGRLWGWIRESPVLAGIRRDAPSDDIVIGRLFMAALSRPPSATERSRFAAFIHDRGANGIEDACCTLLCTAEFLTRH